MIQFNFPFLPCITLITPCHCTIVSMDLSCFQYDSPHHSLISLILLSYLLSHTLHPSPHWMITHIPSHIVDLPWCSYMYKYSEALRISPKLVLLCNPNCTPVHLLLSAIH